jgi:hypothetical protein
MCKAKEIISKLRMLADYYRGISEQINVYNNILEELKECYRSDRTAFSNIDILEINNLKKRIEQFVSPYSLSFKSEKPEKFKKGVVVFHKFLFYVGVIDGTTKIRHLFENPDNEEEYRIRISKDLLKVASPKSLIIIGSAYVNRCYKCKNFVGYSLDKCYKCTWYICLNCGACGCWYNQKRDFDD